MYLLTKWHQSTKRQRVLCYSLRRNQKTHLKIVTSSAISLKLIPGVSPVLESMQVGNNKITPSNGPTRKTDNITQVLLHGNFSHKEAHYLLPIKYASPQERIILLNTPTFVKGQREEEMPKHSIF